MEGVEREKFGNVRRVGPPRGSSVEADSETHDKRLVSEEEEKIADVS